MKNFLLVAPVFEYHDSGKENAQSIQPLLLDKKAFMAPLALAILAALTPDDIEVDIWDETIHGCIDDSTNFSKIYNLVGITGYSSQKERMKAIAHVFQKNGIPVVMGGAGVSSTPERYIIFADILFIGEAELTWPQFITEWKAGIHRRIYRQITKPELSKSPLPRWDLLGEQIHQYFFGAVQTTRGCPFDCEYCDVPYILGRRPRSKCIEQILDEVKALQKLGVELIFFCDDNFIGKPDYAKELLKRLINLNNSFHNPISFFTQSTLNVAKDDELLELFADANFAGLFIGIETPNKESLKEMNKFINYRTDILADIHKIQSYGLPITAGIIVGFDHDTTEIFNQQFEFLQKSCIPKPMIHLLCAPEGTKLWYRLHKAGRILAEDDDPIMPRTTTNVIPTGMTREELFKGYLSLHEKIRNWHNFVARVNGFISGIKRKPKVKQVQQQERNPEHLRNLYFCLDEKTRNAVLSILRHTNQHAPFMIPRVILLIFVYLQQAHLLERIRVGIQKQIELESSKDFKLEFVQIEEVIPESFNEIYNDIFPDIYHRVYHSVADKGWVEEALITIFTAFLNRWGKEFTEFKDYHQKDLDTTCDRLIAEANRALRDTPLMQGDEEIPNIKKSELADDILHAVEQELRCTSAQSQMPVELIDSEKLFMSRLSVEA